MTDTGSLLVDATTKIFQDLCEPTVVNSKKDERWKIQLWSALEESGLTLAWVPETVGGSGATLADGFDILGVSGRFAVPIPLGETLLAGWFLSQGNLKCPLGPMTIAPTRFRDRLEIDSDGRLSGHVLGVPFADKVENIIVLAYQTKTLFVAQIAREDCIIASSPGLSGDGRDMVTFNRSLPKTIAPLSPSFGINDLSLMGATMRAIQISGGLQEILALTTTYAQERIAFGRPISKFQAVQHNLAKLAGETAAAVAAATSASDTLHQSDSFDESIFLEVASAKIRTGEAVGQGAAIAHQIHGAIGFTEEHILHRYTQRLWAWRDDFGSESEWAVQLGKLVAEKGADELWPLLASR